MEIESQCPPREFHSSVLRDDNILKPFQKAAGSIERDENYVPYERSRFGLPPPERASRFDYMEVFDETPLCTLGRMVIMQILYALSLHFVQVRRD